MDEEKPRRKVERSYTLPTPTLGMSPREIQVLFALMAGHADRTSLARKLVISPQTVKIHLTSMYAKANVHNLAELVLWAIKHGYTVG